MKHHKHSPSSFPMKNRCPQFESAGGGSSAADRGSAMHFELNKKFVSGLTTESLDLFELSENDMAEVEWAHKTISDLCSATWPIESEIKVSYHDSSFKEMYYGTCDIVNGPNIYDLKTGEQHAYWHQMAGYALALMSERGYKVVKVHLLFSRYQKIQSYTITREQAEPAILDIIAKAEQPEAPCYPNEFCGWCKKNAICHAVRDRANAIVSYNDWKLDSYNPNEITKDPEQLSKAIHLSRLMKKWVYAVDEIAKEHDCIPGFEWKEVKGRRYIEPKADLCEKLDISPEDFIENASISMSKLQQIISRRKELTLAESTDYIEKKVPNMIKQGNSYKKLQEQKNKGDK